ncbi:hypothetical protein D3C80_801170 [compost metagenome]
MTDLNFLNQVAQNGGAIPDELRTEPVIDTEVEALRARLARLGVKFHHKAGPEKLRELLNAELDDNTHGLTRREINADLENLQVEFHPDAPREDLLKLRDEAKAAATASNGGDA